MKRKLSLISLALLLLGLFMAVGDVAPASAHDDREDRAATYTFPIGGVHADRMCAFYSFNGTYTLTNFAVQDGKLVSLGTISGTITYPCGQPPVTITDQPQTLPVSSINATCSQVIIQFGLTQLQANTGIILQGATLNISARGEEHNFCSLARAVSKGAPPDTLAHKLNKKLGLVRD
ncbi:MAG: hypothetical protein JWP00_2016 [Chloroflexi bacterium]|jgi:hypothetical protein|nr:hypothetical protein [Chloroflexota bacterium]